MTTAFLPVVQNGIQSYLASIRRIPVLSAEEEYMLANRFRNHGDLSAAKKLISAHLRLAAKVAFSYRFYGLPLEDLISEANIGLMQAVKRFEPDKGNRLSTYAVWWIKQAISREIMVNGFVIRIPVHMMERINKISAIINKFTDYTHDELIQQVAGEMKMTVDAVKECLVLRANILTYMSLNEPMGEEEDSELIEFIPSEDVQSVEDTVIIRELRSYLDEALETLSDRERQVLRMRFGLDDGECRTLEDTGQQFGVTRERIRQIEAKALKKMRLLKRAKKLKGFL